MARKYPTTNKAARPVKENKAAQPDSISAADIKKMTTAQLTALAAELGADIAGAKNNDEREAIIIAALEKKAGGSGE
jgi:hypothetical protein